MTIKAWLREEEDDHILVYDAISDEEDMMSESADRDEDGDENDDENESVACDDIMSLDNSSDGNSKVPLWVKLPSDAIEPHDWQMDVSIEGKLEVTSYMVHRSKLGPQSEYFNILFRENGFSESHMKKSTVHFPANIPVDLQCSHFEHFLDFFYLDVPSRWDENEILSLLYLADYFEVKGLGERYVDVICYNLAFNQSHEWIASAYKIADFLSNAEIKCTVAWLCRCNYDHFCGIWDSLQSDELKRKLLCGICKLRYDRPVIDEDFEANSDDQRREDKFDDEEYNNGRWNKLVLHAIHTSPEIVDANLFPWLTYKEFFWKDSWEWTEADVAIEYLKHEQRLSLDKPDTEKLTELQEVCIKSIFADASYTCGTAKDIMETLGKLKPAIMRSLLFRFLDNEHRESAYW